MSTIYMQVFISSLFFWILLLAVSNGVEYTIRKQYLGSMSTSSLACSILNCLLVFIISPILLADFQFGQANSWAVDYFLIFETSFFIAHAMIILLSAKQRIDELFHHSIGIAFISAPIWMGRSGQEILLLVLIAELSGCFHLSHFFKSINYKNAAQISRKVFDWAFIITRGLIIPPLSYLILIDPGNSIILKVAILLFNLLNVYWMKGIWKPTGLPNNLQEFPKPAN